jgi:hypothetical protein
MTTPVLGLIREAHVWMEKLDALADDLKEALPYKEMWENLRDGLVDWRKECSCADCMNEWMDAIELQFLPGPPDDPAEIDRRRRDLRGDVDE